MLPGFVSVALSVHGPAVVFMSSNLISPDDKALPPILLQ